MKRKMFVCIIAFFVSTLLIASTPFKNAYAASAIVYLNLPPHSMPMGMVYDSSRRAVWVALYQNMSIAKVDVTTLNITYYPLPWDVGGGFYGPMPWTLAIDGNGDLWVSIRGYMIAPYQLPSAIPVLAKLNMNNETFTIFWIPKELSGGCDIKYHGDFIWYMTNNGLSKINYTTNTIVKSWTGLVPNTASFGGGFMKPDGIYLWLTSVSNNFVTRFNILTELFDLNLTGFERPLGIDVDSKYVYVAENRRSELGETFMGTIARIDKTTLKVVRLNTTTATNEGPYYVLKDRFGYLWFTDGSCHFGIVGGLIWNAPPLNLFMIEVPKGLISQIWFTAHGSAHIGIKDTGTIGKADINLDGKVDIKDVSMVSRLYGVVSSDPDYKAECDINSDGRIDIKDVAYVSRSYGMTL